MNFISIHSFKIFSQHVSIRTHSAISSTHSNSKRIHHFTNKIAPISTIQSNHQQNPTDSSYFDRKLESISFQIKSPDNAAQSSPQKIRSHETIRYRCRFGHVVKAYKDCPAAHYCPTCMLSTSHSTLNNSRVPLSIKSLTNLASTHRGFLILSLKHEINQVVQHRLITVDGPLKGLLVRIEVEETMDGLEKYSRTLNKVWNDVESLEKLYKGVKSTYLWRCEYGHEFKWTADRIRQGSWCKICKTNERRRKQLEKLKKLANELGGECLSGEYYSANGKLKWKCRDGHVFDMAPNNIVRSSAGKRKTSWCGQCSRSKLTRVQLT
mmetsp:Transcript_514/g.921  ORF Transcript_514/g.921 Transcript_514/m.921 type:complete len:323 (-) Transcript_514:775-1743(-)